MKNRPEGATHASAGAYYRKRPQGGADIWCNDRARWVYMEDRSARKALKEAIKL